MNKLFPLCNLNFYTDHHVLLDPVDIPVFHPGSLFPQDAHGRPLVCACTFDNRGVGLSTIPQRWHHYSSTIMAEDVAQLLDHLGWHSKV